MIQFRSGDKAVTTNESQIFVILGPNTDGTTTFLQNNDATNYISYRFQDSAVNADGSYADIAATGGNFGTSGVLTPGSVAMVNVRSTAPFVRLLASASGGALLTFSITQSVPNTSPYFTTGIQ